MIETDAEWGRRNWDQSARRFGFAGDVDDLWDAMVATRETCWTTSTGSEIAKSDQNSAVFIETLRENSEGSVSDQAIRDLLGMMPQLCSYCQGECWEWCDQCKGCPGCCDSEYHCGECGVPLVICICANPRPIDADGKPMPRYG
jgi:hypothetical protein